MKITDVEGIMLRLPVVRAIGDGCQSVLIIRVHSDARITGVGEAHTNPLANKAVLDAPLCSVSAEGLSRPVDWPLEEQLRLLRRGDVVTYCFRRTPHCIVEDRRVLAGVREARERGVRFDVGHGMMSFDFAVAEAAIGDGFVPDTISTDLQRAHAGQRPVHDLPLVVSKLRAAGMAEPDIFAAVTATPARILGREREIGALRVGGRADLAVLRWQGAGEALVDAAGSSRAGGRWETVATLRAGKSTDPLPNSYSNPGGSGKNEGAK